MNSGKTQMKTWYYTTSNRDIEKKIPIKINIIT